MTRRTFGTVLQRMMGISLGLFVVSVPLARPGAAQVCPAPDGLEDNDTCGSAIPVASGALFGLGVEDLDPDFYSLVVPPGADLVLDVTFAHALGDVDLFLRDAACGLLTSSTSTTDNEQVVWSNAGATPLDLVCEVTLSNQVCNDYILEVRYLTANCPGPDGLEPNDDCAQALLVGSGTLPVQSVAFADDDWFRFEVQPTATMTVNATFFHTQNGDIDLQLFDGCGGALLTSSLSTSDDEALSWTNNSGGVLDARLRVFVVGSTPGICNAYELEIDRGLELFEDFCTGTPASPGCTSCPCGNGGAPGAVTGCSNPALTAAALLHQGLPSVTQDTLRFEATGVMPSTFAVLVAGTDALPANPQNPCFGLDSGVLSVNLDGLRCAGGSVRRLGPRASSASGTVGDTTPGWGRPDGPAEGIVARVGALAGDTRTFQVIYRTPADQGCQTGQNTSQGVAVVFIP